MAKKKKEKEVKETECPNKAARREIRTYRNAFVPTKVVMSDLARPKKALNSSKYGTRPHEECGGTLVYCQITPRERGLRSFCLWCGYRFYNGEVSQLTLEELNKIRSDRNLKPLKRLRRRHNE